MSSEDSLSAEAAEPELTPAEIATAIAALPPAHKCALTDRVAKLEGQVAQLLKSAERHFGPAHGG